MDNLHLLITMIGSISDLQESVKRLTEEMQALRDQISHLEFALGHSNVVHLPHME